MQSSFRVPLPKTAVHSHPSFYVPVSKTPCSSNKQQGPWCWQGPPPLHCAHLETLDYAINIPYLLNLLLVVTRISSSSSSSSTIPSSFHEASAL
mmetsp:Transcript_27148/g.74447  ORF Transcript_27148/g.74447 Transcript_27148/m.74447 type:complete len:94 (-) Transcript_27148:350-631(-)